MSSRDVMTRTVTWREIVLPRDDGTGGRIEATLLFRPRHGGNVVTADIVALTEHRGWPVTAHRKDHAGFQAGLVSAAFSIQGSGMPVVTLTWPDAGDWGVPRSALVSDLPRLLAELDYQRAVRALYLTLPTLGRPVGSGLTVDAIIEAMRGLRAADDPAAFTQERVAEALDVSLDTVKAVGQANGGWVSVRDRALAD